ncbi:MAG: hypothetical protein KAJ19_21655, partial [Gammaproteobacteria bacterium]|nr:hypothetical protein [Gammaproteobacteria bacterium]
MNSEMLTAKKWYWWLWLSPFLTLPTLAIVGLFGYFVDLSIVIALILSALWHLVLLIPSLNKQSDFIRWHGRQALMLAAIRTAVPISLLIVLGDVDGLLKSIPLLVAVWLFGTRWGQAQAVRGECSLANWLGHEISLPLPESEVILKGDDDPDALVEVIRFNRDPRERRVALLKLEKLGMVEGLDQVSASLPAAPAVAAERVPVVKKDRSYLWLIVLGAAIVLITGLFIVNQRREKRLIEARFMISQGEDHATQGDIAKAIELYTRAQEIEPRLAISA